MPTAPYAAPETLETGCLSAASDMWAFGMMLLRALEGPTADVSFSPTGQILLRMAHPSIEVFFCLCTSLCYV